MSEFPHLRLPFKVDGSYNMRNRFKSKKNPITEANKANRANHGDTLKKSIGELLNNWDKVKKEKIADGIELPNEKDIPIFLKIDDFAFKIDSFLNWGIEVISEEENGFILGASVDGLELFQKNLQEFLEEKGTYKDKAAQIFEIFTDDSVRINEILKGDLKPVWERLQDNVEYIIELGISCYVPNTKIYPTPDKFDTEEKYQIKLKEFEDNERSIQLERDAKQRVREDEIERYIRIYKGGLIDIWDNEVDAVFFKIKINGKGLRDIVQTYQYLYRVSLPHTFNLESGGVDLLSDIDVEIIAPDNDAPKVCVIDSGIMQDHRLIAPAIDPNDSLSFVLNDTSTIDNVRISGHGTKVAGAILYPRLIPKNGSYKLETWLQNARILDNSNRISDSEFGPSLIQKIVIDHYSETKIFNLSVCEDCSYKGTHMPELAGAIDKLIHENEILFIISAGNIKRESGNHDIPGIKEHLENGKIYPEYLLDKSCGISNPGVSYFALTVGSISHSSFQNDDYAALAGLDRISPFSRIGLGMWNSIKPEVVEYGGDLLKNKNSYEIITHHETSVELVNSTLHGAPAFGKDSVGTSFSTPKVSFIASKLQKELPRESPLMYRALIVQSARLPDHCFRNPTLKDIQYYGYGIPNVENAFNNNSNRITFITKGNISAKKADIYKINIPNELKGEGKNFKILVEVTLSFTAKTRLTRKGAHSYLATWLEWKSSKYNESFESFRSNTIDYLDLDEDEIEEGTAEEGDNPIKWVIRENKQWGVHGVSRNYNTVQKDWSIIEPYQFAENFSLAIIGHAGWDKNLKHEIPYALCVSFEIIGEDINIYNLLAEAQIETETEQEIG